MERVETLYSALVYDGLWLTKFPLLFTPGFGIARLDTLNKLWLAGTRTPEAAAEVLELCRFIDADVLRFVLGLKPADLEVRVEIFFGGRAMNKPLWQYLAAWFEHSAVLRGQLGPSPGMFETAFE